MTSDHVTFHLASLALCAVAPSRPQPAVAAAVWHNRLTQLGVAVPLFLTHDLGWLLSLSPGDRDPARLIVQGPPGIVDARYPGLMRDLLHSTAPLADMGLREGLLIALLARLLGPISRRYTRIPGADPIAAGELPVDVFAGWQQGGGGAASGAGSSAGARRALDFCSFVCDQSLSLLTQLELIDTATVRMLADTPAGPRPSLSALHGIPGDDLLATPDLISALDAPDVRDVVHFSQDLLPSLLEGRPSRDRQTYPIGGLASIERRGSLDSLLGSELVYDDALLLHRLQEGEALYYGRERPPDERRGSVQILVDASASMRGQRQIFARGLALSLAARLALRGDGVTLRFFDGRLHPPMLYAPAAQTQRTATTGQVAQRALLGLLLFRSERGRNYRRVFEDLLRELRSPRGGRHSSTAPPSDRATQPDAGAEGRPTIYFLTHAQCHIPRQTVQDLAALADLYAVFVRPSGELKMDYLPSLRSYHVVTDDALSRPEERRRQALGIIQQATASRPSREEGR